MKTVDERRPVNMVLIAAYAWAHLNGSYNDTGGGKHRKGLQNKRKGRHWNTKR